MTGYFFSAPGDYKRYRSWDVDHYPNPVHARDVRSWSDFFELLPDEGDDRAGV